MVDAFCSELLVFLEDSAPALLAGNQTLRIVDLFCGDGRLGASIACTLPIFTNRKIHTTYIDSATRYTHSLGSRQSEYSFIKNNVFEWTPKFPFDLVLLNPPFLALTASQSTKMGLPWDAVRRSGRNLYGLGIRHALELCSPGGLVAAIAPFGWVNGEYASKMRCELLSLCSRIAIHAYPQRRVFENVSQDIAFQFFLKGDSKDLKRGKFQFGFNGHRSQSKTLVDSASTISVATKNPRVRIGPLVWNRQKDSLTGARKNAYLVVYGANIDGHRQAFRPYSDYASRKYVLRSHLPKEFLTKAPALFIRRVMRGRPGAWIVDSILRYKGHPCVAENHVIVVELSSSMTKKKCESIRAQITLLLEEFASLSGSPNLPAEAVRRALNFIKG